MAPAAKRMKPSSEINDSELEFRIKIDQVGAFRQLVDQAGSVLTTLPLIAVKHEASGGVLLTLDSIDPQHVCMVQARLVCDGFLRLDSNEFCFDKDVFSHCLHNVPRHHTLELLRYKNSANVTMRSIDAMTQRVDLQFELSTIDDDSETMDLGEMDYDFETQTDIPTLRAMVKLSSDLGCDTVRLSMYVDKAVDASQAMLAVSGKSTTASFTRFLTSSVEGATDAKAQTDISKLHLGHTCEFTRKYLSSVIKNMEHQFVTLKMGNELPLLLDSNLGIEESYVRFVLSPRQDDADM